MYLTYQGIEAKILDGGSIWCSMFKKTFKSKKSFKKWAFNFSYKYLDTFNKKGKESILNYSNIINQPKGY